MGEGGGGLPAPQLCEARIFIWVGEVLPSLPLTRATLSAANSVRPCSALPPLSGARHHLRPAVGGGVRHRVHFHPAGALQVRQAHLALHASTPPPDPAPPPLILPPSYAPFLRLPSPSSLRPAQGQQRQGAQRVGLEVR